MAKTPDAPEQVLELQAALETLKAQVAELTTQHDVETAALKADLADALHQLDAQKGWNAECVRAAAELEAERARQHETIKDLHARLTGTEAPQRAEPEVIMAPNVRKYGG